MASLKNAPYLCVNEPWFGQGYYFWDDSIKLAEWWGEEHCNSKYIITKAVIDFPDGSLLDHIDNMQHIEFFNAVAQTITDRLGEEATVPKIVEELRKREDFTFWAVRGCGIPFKPNKYSNSPYVQRIRFAENVNYYLDMLPRHQICIFDKSNIPPLEIVKKS